MQALAVAASYDTTSHPVKVTLCSWIDLDTRCIYPDALFCISRNTDDSLAGTADTVVVVHDSDEEAESPGPRRRLSGAGETSSPLAARERREPGRRLTPPSRPSRLAGPRPFFNYLTPELNLRQSEPRSVFSHMFDDLMEWFWPMFIAAGLQAPLRGEWGRLSASHLALMHSTMADLHNRLDELCVDRSKLAMKASDSKAFLDKTMLNDTCVDHMVETLCQALGTKTVGLTAGTRSELLKPSDEAGKYLVLGVLQTQKLSEDPGSVLRYLVGKNNVAAALDGRLDPLNGKVLLAIRTHAKHTTMVEVVREPSWSFCIYDTFYRQALDQKLRKGMCSLLEKTGLKKTDASLKTQRAKFMKQKDGTVCALMVFLHLVQKLTGERLDPACWDVFVDVVRLFFNLWLFHRAEYNGAIRPGNRGDVP